VIITKPVALFSQHILGNMSDHKHMSSW